MIPKIHWKKFQIIGKHFQVEKIHENFQSRQENRIQEKLSTGIIPGRQTDPRTLR